MIRVMSTNRVTVSLDSGTLSIAKQRASSSGMSLSSWLDQAARDRALREDFEAHAVALRASGWPSAADLDEHRAYLEATERLTDAAG